MSARIRRAVGHAQVARELRAAAGLMADLRTPVTARAPWLTAVLNVQATRRPGGRPVAVVVEGHRSGRPDAVAFLHLRRRGPAVTVSVLGNGVGPVPGGRPPARLPARDDEAAALLASGVTDLLAALRGPWRLDLAGLPMGDPALGQMAARMPDVRLANSRSRELVDDLDERGPVIRSTDPRALERWLPALLERVADRRERSFLRAAARLHAAIGRLEVAVTGRGDEPRAALLTLLDGGDRRPWWGFADEDLPTVPGAPLVGLAGSGLGFPGLSRRGAGR